MAKIVKNVILWSTQNRQNNSSKFRFKMTANVSKCDILKYKMAKNRASNMADSKGQVTLQDQNVQSKMSVGSVGI